MDIRYDNITFSTDVLDRIHRANFDMLCEVDRVCKKHHIRYFLHGGTLLGAIRHQDFIPWDDDVDLAFPRKDYERFLKVFPQEAAAHFQLLNHNKYPQFYDFITKVAYTRLTLRSSYGDGDGQDAFVKTDSCYVDPTAVRSCYPSSKRAAKTLCVCYHHEYGVDAVIARPCHAYGQTMTPTDSRAATGEAIILRSAGTQVHSFCYVADMAAGLLQLARDGL